MMNRNIQQQYKTAENLAVRRSIHEKYSTNRQPFGDWILEHYDILPGFRILELGCGTGYMWKDRIRELPADTRLILSDFSSGMLESARETVGSHERVEYQTIDIQNIPYPENSFDRVIANMMLYHVPDIGAGLEEVRRVMKPGGKFYAATYGERGMMEFINHALSGLGIRGEVYGSFTLQNGAATLGKHFDEVQMFTRDDGLQITNVDDFVDYVLSLSSLTGMTGDCRDALHHAFEREMKDGVLYVPKEYGIFICK